MLPTQLSRHLWDDPTETMRKELSRWFGGGFNEADWVAKYPVDIRETEDAYIVEAEMPGFTKDQISISLENGTLAISAERKSEQQKGEQHLKERRYTKVARSFTLPTRVDESRVDAKLENGVLHLTLPKSEEVKPRKIAIK